MSPTLPLLLQPIPLLPPPPPPAVFAPSNSAYPAAVDRGLVTSAQLQDPAFLTALLRDSIVPQRLTLEDLSRLGAVTAVSGKSLPVARAADGEGGAGCQAALGANCIASRVLFALMLPHASPLFDESDL